MHRWGGWGRAPPAGWYGCLPRRGRRHQRRGRRHRGGHRLHHSSSRVSTLLRLQKGARSQGRERPPVQEGELSSRGVLRRGSRCKRGGRKTTRAEGAGAKSNCGWPSSTGKAVAGTGSRGTGSGAGETEGGEAGDKEGMNLPCTCSFQKGRDGHRNEPGERGAREPTGGGRGAEERGHRGPGSADPCMLKYLR